MTEQDRAQAAQNEVQAVLNKYGCTIIAGIPSIELHGDLYFVKAGSQISIAPIPNWTAPVETANDTPPEQSV